MNAPTRTPLDPAAATDVDVIIIGAGFSGLGMAIALLKAGRRSFVVLERAGDVGGTWRDNVYPGCACDIPSALYSFSFDQNPHWSRMYPTQPEIWAYLKGLADRYGLTPFIRFNERLDALTYDEDAGRWRAATARGGRFSARVAVLGMGGLSNPAKPRLNGAERFLGRLFHSAEWDRGYDLTGKRIAVIGSGASAIQIVPEIAPKVARLHQFQRTAPWVMPKPDRPMAAWEKRLFSLVPFTQTLLRGTVYCRNELLVPGFTRYPRILKRAQRLAGAHMEAAVADPALRAKLTPSYVMGCKRVLISNDYYPTLTRDNVELVVDPIDRLTETGVVTQDGAERPVDGVVLATGFTATEPMKDFEVTGPGGRSLASDWAKGPEAYLGVTVAGYPNLFMLMGPNTGLGHNSMVYMIESQIRYVMDALRLMDRKGARAMSPRPGAQAAFNAEIQARLARTVWNAGGCRSWYLTGDGHNSSLWPGFTFEYRARTRKVDAAAYELAG
jgi:cation diffusion facilitator CzcD-associated flavoprotein CzcO